MKALDVHVGVLFVTILYGPVILSPCGSEAEILDSPSRCMGDSPSFQLCWATHTAFIANCVLGDGFFEEVPDTRGRRREIRPYQRSRLTGARRVWQRRALWFRLNRNLASNLRHSRARTSCEWPLHHFYGSLRIVARHILVVACIARLCLRVQYCSSVSWLRASRASRASRAQEPQEPKSLRTDC